MARNKTGSTSTQPANAEAAPTDALPPEDPANAPLVNDTPVIGRVEGADAPPAEVQRYRVIQGGSVMLDGNRTIMATGKVIDERTYDLNKLRTQGIRMEPLPQPTQEE